MGFTALEWRKEIQMRGGAGDLLESWGVEYLSGRLSNALALYPEEEQEILMARLKLELEPTNQLNERGEII